jgi:hypothetical protein
MKKIVLFLFVAIATLSVKAQDLYMGGTVGLWRNDDANTTSFKLAPEIGYNLSEQWALGVELQFNHEYKEHISTNTFALLLTHVFLIMKTRSYVCLSMADLVLLPLR